MYQLQRPRYFVASEAAFKAIFFLEKSERSELRSSSRAKCSPVLREKPKRDSECNHPTHPLCLSLHISSSALILAFLFHFFFC